MQNIPFASRVGQMPMSAIREILKVVAKPGMISLAGGSPAPESFPIEIIRELCNTVIDKYSPNLFQYGVTEGFEPLRNVLKNYIKVKSIDTETVFVSTGAQSAIDAVAKIMIDKGDKVAVEAPTFLGSIKTFRAYEPELVEIKTDENGIIPEDYETKLKSNKIKFTYIIPNFQNPTGATLTFERRKAIAEIAKKYDSLIVEDDPYFELRYKGEHIPSIYSLAPENTVHIGSLSKILSPGMRLGYFLGPEEITKNMVSAIQGVDVHTNNLAQAIAAEYIDSGLLAGHLPKITKIYTPRLEKMIDSIKKYFPTEVKYSNPDGGMFVWCELGEKVDVMKVYEKAIEANVAFVPGHFFYPVEGQGKGTIRLNFTNVNEEKIERGIRILGEILAKIC